MMRSPLFRGGRIKTSTRRKTLLTPLRPIQDTKDTPTTTRATPGQETTPTGMENTASTANYKTTLRMNVSRGFEKRNRAEIGKAEPIGQECI
jgi:hypothetical protein